MPTPERATGSAWWRYVGNVTGNASQKDIAGTTGIDQSSISRWQHGATAPRAETVIALARAYGRSPVEALVAAGYLTLDELGVAELTTLTGELGATSIDALFSEVGRRVLASRSEVARQWPAGWTADSAEVPQRDDEAVQ